MSARNTVKFAGIEINLSQVSRDTGIGVSHLSRIFSSKTTQSRSPSIKTAKKLAGYLNMSIENFLTSLEGRVNA